MTLIILNTILWKNRYRKLVRMIRACGCWDIEIRSEGWSSLLSSTKAYNVGIESCRPVRSYPDGALFIWEVVFSREKANYREETWEMQLRLLYICKVCYNLQDNKVVLDGIVQKGWKETTWKWPKKEKCKWSSWDWRCKLKGMAQVDLAKAVDLSRTHISNLEAPNMTTSISLEKLFDIADVLDVPVMKFLWFQGVRCPEGSLNCFFLFSC